MTNNPYNITTQARQIISGTDPSKGDTLIRHSCKRLRKVAS